MFNYCPPLVLPDLVSQTNDDGTRFYTTPSGIKLPSVTTILSELNKGSIDAWKNKIGQKEADRISRISSNRGTRVHNLCENFVRNNPPISCMPDSLAMFHSLKKVLTDRVNNIHYIEQSLWSEKLGLAGRTDLIAEFDNTLSVIDYKTSEKMKNKEYITSYFLQSTAYALCYEEIVGTPIENIVILIAVSGQKDPQVFKEKTKDYIQKLYEVIEKYNNHNF